MASAAGVRKGMCINKEFDFPPTLRNPISFLLPNCRGCDVTDGRSVAFFAPRRPWPFCKAWGALNLNCLGILGLGTDALVGLKWV